MRFWYLRSRRLFLSGFTLVELLVVIVVIALLLALALPSMVGSMSAMRLTQAGDMLVSTFSLAQQRSVTLGRPVEVRLYKGTTVDEVGGMAAFRSLVVLEYYQMGENDPRRDLDPSKASEILTEPMAIARQGITKFPSGIVVSETPAMSSMINALPTISAGSNASVPTVMRTGSAYSPFSSPPGSEEYRSIIFYPENTNLDVADKWFLTVVDESMQSASAGDVNNFYTVSLDPVTGVPTTYRP